MDITHNYCHHYYQLIARAYINAGSILCLTPIEWCREIPIIIIITSNDDLQPSTIITNLSPSGLV